MSAEAICITQSGAPAISESNHCFTNGKIWSTDPGFIVDEEKRWAIL